eukprot:scaffold2031_cov179-Ochromonas_danica.AAC.2
MMHILPRRRSSLLREDVSYLCPRLRQCSMSDPKGCFFFIFLQQRGILLGKSAETVFFHEAKL